MQENPFEELDCEDESAARTEFRAVVEKLERLRGELKIAEEEAERLKDDIERLLSGVLPAMMQGMGTTSVGLATGEVLRLQPFVTCSLREGRESEAFAWMRENGHGGMVKDVLTVRIDEKDVGKANGLEEDFAELGWDVDRKVGIHAATLKAWATARSEAGEEFPDCFKVSRISRANVRKK